MNLSAIASLSLSISCLLLAGIISINSSRKLHRIWALFNLSVSVFGLGSFLIASADKLEFAVLGWRIFWFGLIFISVLFYHLVLAFCEHKETILLKFAYSQAVLFALLALFTNLMTNRFLHPFGFYYAQANFVNTVFFVIWSSLSVFTFFTLYKYKKQAKDIKRIQASYLFYGMMLGFISGSTTALPCYGINVYPAWHFFICVYAAICSYAIFRYQLLDIKVVVTRFGAFLFVYSLVLGFPFWLGWKMLGIGKWLIPATIGTILSSLGPFIYLFIQRRAEAQLLREQRRVHDVIKKASAGIVGIREMQKLLNVLMNVLKENLRLEHISIYLFESNDNAFILNASKPEMVEKLILNNNHSIFERLKNTKCPVFIDEMLYLRDNSNSKDGVFEEIVRQMHDLSASVIIPAVKKDEKKDEDILLAFIVLGKRQGKESFSSELLEVLKVVGNEFALGIEIILSLIERDRLLNENFEIRRFESLGLLCNSMSHQMNNRFQSIVNLLLNPLDIFSEGRNKEYSKEELTVLLEDFAKSCKRIDEISKEGGKLTKDILNFSRGKMEFGVVNFEEMITKSLNFLEQKHPKFKYEIRKEYPQDVKLWGSELSIKDLIYNAVDNSCFAMQSKQERGGEYTPTVTIRGRVNGTMFYFEIEDNGMGIKKDDVKRVMDPMFTTKGHNKGSGMGTTFIQQIVQKHGGTIVYESEWEKWTKVRISLPLATKEQKGE